MAKNTLAALVGPSGCGKSFIAIDLACHVALGIPWHGHNALRGGVFYLAGEGRQGIRKRVAAWEKHYQRSMALAPLYISSEIPFLCSESGALGTQEAIDVHADEMMFNSGGVEPALIIVDTVARAMVGENENTAEAMGRFIRSLDILRGRSEATVLAVHHTGHGAAARARGSSAFFGALDCELLVRPRVDTLELSVTKAKDWPIPTSMILSKRTVSVKVDYPDGNSVDESSLVLTRDVQLSEELDRIRTVLRLWDSGKSGRQIEVLTGTPRSTAQFWKAKYEQLDR